MIKKVAAVAAAAGGLAFAGAGAAMAGAGAEGAAVGSGGIGSGNVVQVPVDGPANACGNTVNVIGLMNSAFGNSCVNH
ncbi:chaplin [Streptomyces sp. TRM 70361]|uniref:chaplin n=1 Tax=Streptomyces sp. TRM 70361 TaxID=3116553 RepID=UPI002E7B6B64|nr:chaplin [Streptomyces sp. TRM 70361]MEE1942798.1 chaplin [Streptomyces sp. TRM 70361]